MKTLFELWAERKTPTILVRRREWVKPEIFEIHAVSERYAFGFFKNGELYCHFWDLNLNDFTLVDDNNPPATKRVYQALCQYMYGDREYFIDIELFETLEDAKDHSDTREVIRLLDPGFEVPA